MKKRSFINACVLAATVGFMPTAFAESPTPAVDDIEVDASEAALAAIGSDRGFVISNIVAAWEAEMGNNSGWSAEFTAALEGASNEQLMAIQSAASYDTVQAILQGRNEPVSVEGLSGTQELGSLTSDLVYTPVVPCRFFDTRFDVFGGPGGGNPGTQLNYRVHGSNAQLAPQGHTAGTGCTSPGGEPVAVAANFTVVPYGKGHIRAWPFTSAQPNASFLNYNNTVNSNLANAGIIATCYLCGNDISVSTWFGSSDSLADAMGYFYPADDSDFEVITLGTASNSTINVTACTNYLSRSITVPGPGKIAVEATALYMIDHDTGWDGAYLYIGKTSTECTYQAVASEGYISQFVGSANTGEPAFTDRFVDASARRTVSVGAAGTYTYYLNTNRFGNLTQQIDGGSLNVTYYPNK